MGCLAKIGACWNLHHCSCRFSGTTDVNWKVVALNDNAGNGNLFVGKLIGPSLKAINPNDEVLADQPFAFLEGLRLANQRHLFAELRCEYVLGIRLRCRPFCRCPRNSEVYYGGEREYVFSRVLHLVAGLNESC